jgi:uncharacterized UPF0160 family protein
MKTIVTHGANFHADDLFGSAAMTLYYKYNMPNEKVRIVRSLDPKVWATGDVVLDIGRVYSPVKNRFDHHQEIASGFHEPTGIPYAAFGLVWKKYGPGIVEGYLNSKSKKIVSKPLSKKIADYVEAKLVVPLDAADNGILSYQVLKFNDVIVPPMPLDLYVKMECDLVKDGMNDPADTKGFDKAFMRLVPFASRVIEAFIVKGSYNVEAEVIAKKYYVKAKDKKVIVCDQFVGYNFGKFPEPLFTVYPDMRGNWSAKVVLNGEGADPKDARVFFPKAWAGKDEGELVKITGVQDAIFCHNGRFLAVARSKEGVMKLVELALAKK